MTQPVLVSEVDRPDSRRFLKFAVAGLVVLLLVGVVLPKFVFGGGDDGGDAALAASPTPPSTIAPGPGDGEDAPETGASFSSNNPFVALIADVSAPAGPVDGTTGQTQPAVSDSVLPQPTGPLPTSYPSLPSLDLPSPAPTPAPPTTSPTAPAPGPTMPPVAPAPRAVRQFTLVEIYTDGSGLVAATIKVDGTNYSVAVGQDFAGYFRALALDRISTCGVFLYGDRRFSLCQGETATT